MLITRDDIYYMMQYEPLYGPDPNRNDEEILDYFNALAKGLTKEDQKYYKKALINISNEMAFSDDDFNQEVYNYISRGHSANEIIKNSQIFVDYLTYIANWDWDDLEEFASFPRFDDWKAENAYYNLNEAWDIVDENLKEYGINSPVIDAIDVLRYEPYAYAPYGSDWDNIYIRLDGINNDLFSSDSMKKEYADEVFKDLSYLDLYKDEEKQKVEITDKTVKEAQKLVAGIVEKESETAKVKNTK